MGLRGGKTGIFERGRVVTRAESQLKAICDWRVKKYVELRIFRGFGMSLGCHEGKNVKTAFVT